MNTDQATYLMAFLLRAPRRGSSWELKKAAKQRLATIQHALEAYEKLTFSSDEQALAQLNHIYTLLNAKPPSATDKDLATRKHPLLKALDSPSPGAETDAWKTFLTELRKLA